MNAFLNSWVGTQIWQVTLLILFVALIVRLFCKERPHLAHALWLLVLIKCITPPIWSSPCGVFSWMQAAPEVEMRTMSELEPEPVTPELATIDVEPEPTLTAMPMSIETEVLPGRPMPELTFPPTPIFVEMSDEHVERPTPVMPPPVVEMEAVADIETPVVVDVAEESTDVMEASTGVAEVPPASVVVPTSRWTRSNVLAALWAAGAFISVALAAMRWLGYRHTIRRYGRDADQPLDELAVDLARRIGLRCRPRVVLISFPTNVSRKRIKTSGATTPAVIGFFRATVLLPELYVEGRTPKDLEPILAHELIHARRRDSWIGLLQVAAIALWWAYPLVRWAQHRLSEASEQCCDEAVLAVLGCTPARYAGCLLDAIERRSEGTPFSPVPGVGPLEGTKKRLERIMKLRQGCRKSTPVWCWMLFVMLGAVVLPGAARSHDEGTPPRERRSPDRQIVESTQHLMNEQESQNSSSDEFLSVPLNTNVQEARTGTLDLSFGVNRQSGLLGTFDPLDEFGENATQEDLPEAQRSLPGALYDRGYAPPPSPYESDSYPERYQAAFESQAALELEAALSNCGPLQLTQIPSIPLGPPVLRTYDVNDVLVIIQRDRLTPGSDETVALNAAKRILEDDIHSRLRGNPNSYYRTNWADDGRLLVRAADEHHEQIAEMLEQARNYSAAMFTIETRFLEVPPLELNELLSSGVYFSVGSDLPEPRPFEEMFPLPGDSDPLSSWVDISQESSGKAVAMMLSEEGAFQLISGVQQSPRADVLLAPKVTIWSAMYATVCDLSQSPFVTGVTEEKMPVVEVVEEGLRLNMRTFQRDGRIWLDYEYVHTDITDVDSFDLTNGSGEPCSIQIPYTETFRASGRNELEEGQTLLIRPAFTTEREVREETGAPILSDIPYVNRLFRNVSVARYNVSLPIMLTVRRVIEDPTEMAHEASDFLDSTLQVEESRVEEAAQTAAELQPLVTKPYYVGDLVMPIAGSLPDSESGLANAIRQDDLQLSSSQADFHTLMDLIQETVEPESWDVLGGRGTISEFEGNLSLVIRQREDVHEEIVELLQYLRKTLKVQIAYDVRIMTETELGKIGLSYNQPEEDDPNHVLTSEQAQRILDARESWNYNPRRSFPRLTAFNGQIANVQANSSLIASTGLNSTNATVQLSGTATNDQSSVRLSVFGPIIHTAGYLSGWEQADRNRVPCSIPDRGASLLDISDFPDIHTRYGFEDASASVYLFVRPTIIVQEEAEERIGLSPAESYSPEDTDVLSRLKTVRILLDYPNPTPLSQVVYDLVQQAEINILLDDEGLRQANLIPSDTVQIQLTSEVTLENALMLILEPKGLIYCVRDDVCIITTPEIARDPLVTKQYYVGDLVVPIPNFIPDPSLSLSAAVQQAYQATGGFRIGDTLGQAMGTPQTAIPMPPVGDPGTRIVIDPYTMNQMVVSTASPPASPSESQPFSFGQGSETQADFGAIVNLIEETIDPDSWELWGGPGSIVEHEGNLSLVIRQTETVHEEIAELLAQLRKMQDLQITFDTHLLTNSEIVAFGMSGVLPDAGDSQSVLTATQVELLSTAIESNGTSPGRMVPRVSLFNGQEATVADVYEASQSGCFLTLKAVVSEDRSKVRVEANFGDAMRDEHNQIIQARASSTIEERGGLLFDVSHLSYPRVLAGVDDEQEPIYFLVSPEIIVQEEEEVRFGLLVPEPPPMTTKPYYAGDLLDASLSAEDGLSMFAQEIEAQVELESWSEQGGMGAVHAFEGNLSIVVRQTDSVHEEIAAYLKELRDQAEFEAISLLEDGQGLTQDQMRFLVERFNRFMEKERYAEAVEIGEQARRIDLEEPVAEQLYRTAMMVYRAKMYEDMRSEIERGILHVD
jgi:beta-lactamase regulating signal transducer with metallopeptidase domain